MNKRLIFVFAGVIGLFSSCHTYKHYDKESFPDYIWSSGQEVTFEPTIKDISKVYKLIVGLRHMYGLQLKNLPIRINSISPSGKEKTYDYTIQIMDDRNKYMGSCAGSLCDLETIVHENLKFDEPGEYKFIVTHTVSARGVPGIIEVGLIID